MDIIKRVKTYIKGFDVLVGGGFPLGSKILVSGNAGTGKTIFSLQYLFMGVNNDSDVGIYITFEEKKNSLIEQAKQFGWDLKEYEKKNKLKIISLGNDNIDFNTIEEILDIIKTTGAKRLVIDSITTLSYLVPQNSYGGVVNEYSIKKFLYSFFSKLNDFDNLTTLIISQKNEKVSNNLSEYLCDGVISIAYENLGGDFSRNISIEKMRKTKNSDEYHPMEIGDLGIIVHSLE